MNKFRDLKVDEVELRINRINEYGCSLLLYKDARCDMSILDETVGPMNWMRSHTRDNANCIVSIWDKDKEQWISKEDTGKESNAEKEKGQASDSFKRACFNWGIGRELYTAPDIWISAGNVTLKDDKNGKKTTYDKFSVAEFEVKDKKIVKLTIRNDTLKKIVYTMNSKVKQEEPTEPTEQKKYECHNCRKPFQPFTDSNGKAWSAGQVYHLAESSAKKAGFGGSYCSACLKKKQEEQEAKA